MAKLLTEIQEQPKVLDRLLNHFQSTQIKDIFLGKKVFLFGTGASLNACLQAKYAFLKFARINAVVVPAFEAAYYMQIMDQNCMVIVVSQSGESYETKVICDKLMEKEIPFMAITNNPDSYLGKNATYCFNLMAGEELGTATKTQTASVMLLYLLSGLRDMEVSRQLTGLKDAMEKTIVMTESYKKELADFIGESKVLYITGVDVHASTAQQASLMLKEKVWLNVEGTSIAEFRHGPVEVLEENIPVILIGHGEEKIKTMLLHANFLSKVCHAKVALVTNRHERELDGYVNYPYAWDGDEELSHICATLPFQLLAETMAGERNYDIDGFKYIGKILNQYEKPINQ